MKRVLVVGVNNFPWKDWATVINKDEIDLECVAVQAFAARIMKKHFDLVCFFCEGAKVHQLFLQYKNEGAFQKFWQNESIKKVAWSMDTHHQWPIETQYQQYFSTYYTAHSNYIDKFEPEKAKWLPCSLFVDSDRLDLIRLLAMKQAKTFDVVSVYRDYLHIGDRNAAMYECYEWMQEKGISVFLGQTNQFKENGQNHYYQALLSAKIVLNLSIMDDLNMRNFEALALNQVMVTNRVPDHAKIDLDYSNTVFFDRFDQQSFAAAMEEALEKAKNPKQTIDSVINKHMQIHRYVELFNRELGTQLEVPNLDVAKILAELKAENAGREKSVFAFSTEQGDIRYDGQEIGVKAVYSYLQHDQADKALQAMMHLLSMDTTVLHWETNANDLFAILDLCTKKKELGYRVNFLLAAVLKAVDWMAEKGLSIQGIQFLAKLLLRADMQFGEITLVLKKRLQYGLRKSAAQFLQEQKAAAAGECLNAIQALDGKMDTEFYLLAAETNRLLQKPEAALACYEKAVKG